MATARAMIERRRSSRLRIRIPVKIVPLYKSSDGRDARPSHSAEVLAVSRTGALLRAPFSPELGSRIELRHGKTEERREFRVVQVSAAKADGHYELGVEMLYPGRNFWGVKLPDE